MSRRNKTLIAGETIARTPQEAAFREVVAMIETARARAYHAVNTDLIELYWRVGEYISSKLQAAAWGQSVVAELAAYIQRH